MGARVRWLWLWVAGLWLLTATQGNAQRGAMRSALMNALRGTQGSAVVLDFTSGQMVASAGAEVRAAPGSVIKPLVLEYALEHGVVRPDVTVYCRRSLHIAGRNLACAHPGTQPVLDAENALAESCNTWFAELARRMTGAQLEDALRGAHVQCAPIQGANADRRIFAVLGLEGVSVTAEELARSYRELLMHAPVDGVVARGLRGSVEYGMANPAKVRGVTLLGKTGTASEPGQSWTHGWFAGAVPGKLVVVVYVPHGDGGAAAAAAGVFVREALR